MLINCVLIKKKCVLKPLVLKHSESVFNHLFIYRSIYFFGLINLKNLHNVVCSYISFFVNNLFESTDDTWTARTVIVVLHATLIYITIQENHYHHI